MESTTSVSSRMLDIPRFDDRVALVTGGSRGIGRAISLGFAWWDRRARPLATAEAATSRAMAGATSRLKGWGCVHDRLIAALGLESDVALYPMPYSGSISSSVTTEAIAREAASFISSLIVLARTSSAPWNTLGKASTSCRSRTCRPSTRFEPNSERDGAAPRWAMLPLRGTRVAAG